MHSNLSIQNKILKINSCLLFKFNVINIKNVSGENNINGVWELQPSNVHAFAYVRYVHYFTHVLTNLNFFNSYLLAFIKLFINYLIKTKEMIVTIYMTSL